MRSELAARGLDIGATSLGRPGTPRFPPGVSRMGPPGYGRV